MLQDAFARHRWPRHAQTTGFRIIVAFVKPEVFHAAVSINVFVPVNGLGLGNSTRCHAVMQCLAAAGCRIHVLTSGNGLSYFQNRDGIESLSEMESLLLFRYQ